jgi:quercetin dioxygenase-like cupin family protein
MKDLSLLLVIFLVTASACGDSRTGHDLFPPTTTINGEVPPGELMPLQDVTTMLDTIDDQGNRLVIYRGIRLPGTRVGIHVHEFGGHTCVISGVITDFVEGQDPVEKPAGTCYYMPAFTPMSAANLGDEPAILIDTFNLPVGAPTITIIEPGWDEAVAESEADSPD